MYLGLISILKDLDMYTDHKTPNFGFPNRSSPSKPQTNILLSVISTLYKKYKQYKNVDS